MKSHKDAENETYKLYLRDLGYLLKEDALKAKSNKDVSEYNTGYLMAFHRVISLMQQQAEGFQIPLSEIQLEDIDPDTDLT